MKKGQLYMLGACGMLLALTATPLRSEDDMAGVNALTSAFNTLQDGLDLIVPDTLTKKGWRIRLGAGFGTLPNYAGSDDYRLKALPIIDIRYGKRWRLTSNKLSFAAFTKSGWQIGPFVKYKSGRKESKHILLMGMGDIKATAQIGAFARYKDSRKLISLEFRQALSQGRGSTIKATVGHGLFEKGRFKLAAALRGKWLSEKAMQRNFGITQVQAAASTANLDAYSPTAGLSELSLDVIARYDVAHKHRLLGLVSYGRLIGGAANSPLTVAGSPNQLKIGVGFTIDF